MIGSAISHFEIAEKLGEGDLRNGHCGKKRQDLSESGPFAWGV